MLDVRQSRELQAALLALRDADRDLKRDLNKDARAQLTPLWERGLAAKARTPLERRGIVPGARLQAGDRRITAKAATSRRKLSGGLVPADDYGPLEWGANRKRRTIRGRSRAGNPYSYARMVGGQFRPWSKHGHVAMAAAGDVVAAAVSLWVHVVVGHFAKAYDVKAGR